MEEVQANAMEQDVKEFNPSVKRKTLRYRI